MTYQMAATAVTLNDFGGHSPVAGFFKCNPSNVCAAFYTISIDSVLARFLCISRVSSKCCVPSDTCGTAKARVVLILSSNMHGTVAASCRLVVWAQ